MLLYIGRDFLTITNYKQMVGRAGRAGQSSIGESFIVVKPSDTDRAVALVNQPMPDIMSQINPYIDNGSAMLKALVEVIGLEMCYRLGDVFAYINTTLWAHQLDAGGVEVNETKDNTIKEVVQTFIKFLFELQILVKRDVSPLLSLASSNQTAPNDSLNELEQEVEVTRFGKGILGSNFSVDEAIIIYQALYKAQEGLALDNYLHLMYLITPLDHNFMPNFSKLLMYYDKSKKSSNNFLAMIFEAIGGHVGYLSKWQVHPPSKQDIQQCQQVVKISGIEACLQELKSKSSQDSKQPSKMKKSIYTSNEWHLLCICKRFWAAMVLQHILDGVSVDRLCKEYQCEVQDIEDLQRKARMMGSKVQAFCKQLGWSTMYKLTKDFKHNLDADVSKEIKKLLLVPGMTLKVAKVLSDRRVRSAEELVNTSLDTVVLWLQLSLGFELQVSFISLLFSFGLVLRRLCCCV
ncbi:hypothetical protein EON65_26265 [archaeon]|nr:MAG: hypothetical protein EON65_26265 [archaeon]